MVSNIALYFVVCEERFATIHKNGSPPKQNRAHRARTRVRVAEARLPPAAWVRRWRPSTRPALRRAGATRTTPARCGFFRGAGRAREAGEAGEAEGGGQWVDHVNFPGFDWESVRACEMQHSGRVGANAAGRRGGGGHTSLNLCCWGDVIFGLLRTPTIQRTSYNRYHFLTRKGAT